MASRSNTGDRCPSIFEEIMFWFYPESPSDRKHYKIYKLKNWAMGLHSALEPMHDGNYFMGVPLFYDPFLPIQHRRNWDENDQVHLDLGVGYYYTNVPLEFSPTYPNDDPNPAVPQRDLYGTSIDCYNNNYTLWPSGLQTSPGIGIDPHFHLPYIEFDRPSWMDLVPEGTVVNWAFADVKIGKVARTEYKVEWYQKQPFPGSPIYPWLNLPPGISRGPGSVSCQPGKRGWCLWQKSRKAVEAGDQNEEYLPIFKATETVGSDGSTSPDIDNSHIHHLEYEAFMLREYGVSLAPRTRAPVYIPRVVPWVPSTSSYAPRAIAPLTGAKIGHVAVGMQEWGGVQGYPFQQGQDPLKTPIAEKEMERFLLWHPNGYKYNGWEPNAESYLNTNFFDILYRQGEGYLQWLRSFQSPFKQGLDNYRYRVLQDGFSRAMVDPEQGNENIVPDDGQFHAVNLREVIQAIVNDRPRTTLAPYRYSPGPGSETEFQIRHSKYRIYASLPHWGDNWFGETIYRNEDGFGWWNPGEPWASHYLNIAALYGFQMPRIIYAVADGDPKTSYQSGLEDVTFQDFETYEIRNIQFKLTFPSGATKTFTVKTPFG